MPSLEVAHIVLAAFSPPPHFGSLSLISDFRSGQFCFTAAVP